VAVIVQPPDDGAEILVETITEAGFLSGAFLGIIDSTLLVDLSQGVANLVAGYRSSTRKKRNRAIRGGLTVRDGDEHDLPEFFRLMLMTCERQGVHPNPPTIESLEMLWKSLNARRKRAYLKFTLCEGEIVSGDLLIVFAKRATLFKTGWNGLHRELHPNNLRVCEALEWASSIDCVLADFVACAREITEPLLKGHKMTPEQSKYRDAFKTGFGGYPKLLPEACLWVPNPMLRFCFRQAIKVPFIRRKMGQITG
jgi:hypothetical protein